MDEAKPSNPASSSAIESLIAAAPVALPESYIDLLERSNGGEWPLIVQPYNLCLDSAEAVTEAIVDGTYGEFFDGFLIIGSDGGGELIALDNRCAQPGSVVALDATNIDIDESRLVIAANFDLFLGVIEFEPNQTAILELDGAIIRSVSDVHDRIASHPGVPDYYGRNFYAFRDVLNGYVSLPLKIIWTRSSESKVRLGSDFDRFVLMMEQVAEDTKDRTRKLEFELRD